LATVSATGGATAPAFDRSVLFTLQVSPAIGAGLNLASVIKLVIVAEPVIKLIVPSEPVMKLYARL
jgi:hypothetical protein